MSLEGRIFNLVEIENPAKGSFIRLETFCKDKYCARIVHILQPTSTKQQFKLGRGHDSDVKIADISVSRVHAQIVMTPLGFILQDNAAKFGTLLLLPSDLQEIDPLNGLSIQVNRTTLTFNVKPNNPVPALMQPSSSAELNPIQSVINNL